MVLCFNGVLCPFFGIRFVYSVVKLVFCLYNVVHLDSDLYTGLWIWYLHISGVILCFWIVICVLYHGIVFVWFSNDVGI